MAPRTVTPKSEEALLKGNTIRSTQELKRDGFLLRSCRKDCLDPSENIEQLGLRYRDVKGAPVICGVSSAVGGRDAQLLQERDFSCSGLRVVACNWKRIGKSKDLPHALEGVPKGRCVDLVVQPVRMDWDKVAIQAVEDQQIFELKVVA